MPKTPPHQSPARALILRYGWNAMAYQILNPGMRHWFAPDGEAVVGYVGHGGYRVVAGGPICAPQRVADTLRLFGADTRRQGLRVCYFGAQERIVEALADQGPVARLLIGAQPAWSPQHWIERLAHKRSLRAQVARARNKGVVVTPWDLGRTHGLADLQRCLDRWVAARGLPSLHFLVEPQTLANLEDRLVFVASQGGRVVGFLVASPIPLRQGWLVEQIIRSPDAPNGTAEILLKSAIRAMAEAGAAYMTLGLSPLSRRAALPPPPQPLWLKALLAAVRAYGSAYYHFEGLDAFKAKFQPDSWEPVYALVPARQIPIRAVYAIAGAFCGTSPLLFLGRALWRRLRRAAA